MYVMKTIDAKPGYRFSCGSEGKTWTRGRKEYSTGVYYSPKQNGERFPCIVVTDLDTCKKRVATPSEHKRFLTPESYKDFLCEVFKYL